MNKFITKLAKIFLGLSMAAGVGVAIRSKSEVTKVEAFSATMAYSGNTTTNMTATGNATKVGLDSTIFTVNSTKQGSNFPGLNQSHYIALYAGGNSTITVSISSSYIVDSITISYSGSYSPATVLVGDNQVTGSNNTFNIASTSFVLKNAKASGQVRMTSVSISYSASGNLVSLSSGSHGTLTGDTSIATGKNGTVTIVPDAGYKIPSSITSVTGVTSSSYNSSTGQVTLTGVKGDVTINATCPALEDFTVTVNNTNCTYTGSTTIKEKTGSTTLTFTPNSGYGLPNDVTVTNATKSWTKATGTLVLTNATAAPTVTISCHEVTLSSIAVSGGATSFYYGHDFDHSSAVVTATYSDSSQKVVTEDATFSSPDMFTTGNKTITVSYTEAGTKKDTSYSISVSNKTESSGGWARVTSVETLLEGGTYIFGYESTANSGVIIPVANTGSATTSAAGYLYTGSGASDGGNGTIDMSSVSSTSAFEFTVAPSTVVDGAVVIKSGNNYLGNTNTKNNCKFFTSESATTAFTPTLLSNDRFQLRIDANSTYYDFEYNTGNPRGAVYGGTQADMVAYVKTAPVVKELVKLDVSYTGSTKYVGDSVVKGDFTPYKTYDTGSASRTAITGTALNNFSITSSTTLSQGDNTITFSYTEGGITKEASCVYHAESRSAQLTGLTWAQGAYSIIDGEEIDFSNFGVITAEYDNGASSAEKSYSACSFALYSKSGNVYTNEGSLSNGDAIDLSDHEGLYIGVTYSEDPYSFTAYSSQPLDIVERLNEVRAKVETFSYQKTTEVNVDDIVILVNEGNDRLMESSSFGSSILIAQEYTSTPTGAFTFTVGSDGNGDYTLYHEGNGYLKYNNRSTSGTNNIYFNAEKDTTDYTTSWRFEFDENDNAIIYSVYTLNDNDTTTDRTIRYNYNNGTNPRFCCYTTGQADIQLYKGIRQMTPTGSDIANTNIVAQKAVVTFAKAFLSATNDVCEMDGSSDLSVWSTTIKATYTSNRPSSEGTNQDHFDDLIKYADSAVRNEQGLTPTGDSLQKALARYDWIVQHHSGLEDFLHTTSGRVEVSGSNVALGLLTLQVNNTAMIIVIISLVSVSAIGGYFFLRKRKEQ